jgi:predicted ATP-grasp superfamily ATP-dependent carboligase
MNLLITNSQELQAYTILRCLRSEAKKIVITRGGDSVGSTGFRGMAAFSRYVDRQYTVPFFADDWLAGRIQPQNTESEEAYIRRIEEICAIEDIDVVMPSLDPEVYIFSKNKKRLQDKGVLAVVGEFEQLLIPMNKALTIDAAQRVGFPCPKTCFPADAADVESIIADSEPPWIIKPRFTAHAQNIKLAKDAAELRQVFAAPDESHQPPIVQEYILGGGRRNFYVTLDRNSEVLSLLSPEVIRTYKGPITVATKSCISSSNGPLMKELRALLKELGMSGGFTIQTKIDPKDGIPKLLEINPRFGQHLWYRTEIGVNEPLICLQLARGETPSGNLTFPEGVLMLDVIFDIFYLLDNFLLAIARLFRYEKGWGERVPSREILSDYFNRRPKRFGPEVRYCFDDPYPCLRAFLYMLRNTVKKWTPYRVRKSLESVRNKIRRKPAVKQI